MHPKDEEACEQISALLYSGDGGGKEQRQELRERMNRWLKRIDELDEMDNEDE